MYRLSAKTALFVSVLFIALGFQPLPGLAAKALPPSIVVDVPDKVWCGEPFLVRFSGDTLQSVSLRWLKKNLTLFAGQAGQRQKECETMLATGLDEKSPAHTLEITIKTTDSAYTLKRTIRVRQKEYPVQRLTVPPKYASPPKSEQARIELERKLVREILDVITPEKLWKAPFIRPVPGEVTSEYGLRREFNGKKRNPHRGLDLDGANGDPILAACNGVVKLCNNHYYSGNLVIVDHGLGVFTLYMHLSEFAVQPGQRVQRGDVLGYVGSTGRVTGPHLHLSLSVQGLSVNPQTVLEPAPELVPPLQKK